MKYNDLLLLEGFWQKIKKGKSASGIAGSNFCYVNTLFLSDLGITTIKIKDWW